MRSSTSTGPLLVRQQAAEALRKDGRGRTDHPAAPPPRPTALRVLAEGGEWCVQATASSRPLLATMARRKRCSGVHCCSRELASRRTMFTRPTHLVAQACIAGAALRRLAMGILAFCAQKHGVLVHALTLMYNHYHCAITHVGAARANGSRGGQPTQQAPDGGSVHGSQANGRRGGQPTGPTRERRSHASRARVRVFSLS